MSSAAIRAKIRIVEQKLAKVKQQIAKCKELLAELKKVSEETFESVYNLKDALLKLSLGLTIGGKTCGGEQINERITSLGKFHSATEEAIGIVQKKLAELEAEKESLEAELVALRAALAAALAAEAEAAARRNNRALTGYKY